MRLTRDTDNPFETTPNFQDNYCSRTSDSLYASGKRGDGARVCYRFSEFGNGKHRRSKFIVTADWHDMLAMIDKFCEAEHPDALLVREGMKLAEAAKELGWQAPFPPPPPAPFSPVRGAPCNPPVKMAKNAN